MNATNTTTTPVRVASSQSNALVKVQLAALLLMCAGWAWTAGNFAQPQEPLFLDALTDFLHALPLILLVIFGLRYFGALYDALHQGGEVRGAGWAYIGITVVAVFGAVVMTLGGVVLSLVGITNANPNSVGIHNLDDAIPAIIQITGSLLWIVSAFGARRQRTAAAKRVIARAS